MHAKKRLFAALAASGLLLGGADRAPAPPGLLLTEVAAGPAASYVEVFNPSSTAVSLADLAIETSLGSFSLADVTEPLPGGGYFLLAACAPGEETTSNDPLLHLKSVAQPIAGVIHDTVLLRRGAAVLDAVSYGLAPPTSALYQQAVAAGQFAFGQFVDASSSHESLVLGRNAANADTDDLLADWAPHGGADAYAGSPLEANTATLGGEDYAVKGFQLAVNQLLANTYYRMSVTSAGSSGYAGSDVDSTAAHWFVVDSPDLGAGVTLSGEARYRFEPQSEGAYRQGWSATLTAEASASTLTLSLVQTWDGATARSVVNAALIDPASGDVLPYDEVAELQFAGVRGSYSVTHMRKVTDLDGIERSTSGSQGVSWTVGGGLLQAIDTSVDLVRDWPASCLPYGQHTPNPPFTTETQHFDLKVQPSADGIEGVFSSWVCDYGPSYGKATYDDARLSVRWDPSVGAHVVESGAVVTYPSPGGIVTDLGRRALVTTAEEGRLIQVAGALLQSGVTVGTYQLSIDPPGGGDPLALRILRAIRKVLRWWANRGRPIVIGSLCTVATAQGIATDVAPHLPLAPLDPPLPTPLPTTWCVFLEQLLFEATGPRR